MADIMDQVAEVLSTLLTAGPRAIPSAAPGGGPAAAREEGSRPHSMRPPNSPRGTTPLGYGGHGDPTLLAAAPDADVQRAIQQHLRREAAKATQMPRPSGRIRFSQPFSIEAHLTHEYHHVAGPYSLFDGTIAAPSAGNSVVNVPISLPATIPSPVILLDRYPGALYLSLWLRTASYMPTGTTMTGLQELWFTDSGGATAGIGIFLASAQNSGNISVQALLNSPLTDPGNVTLGNLVVNNIGIGGTPVTARYQLNFTWVAIMPNPEFNEQMIIPPTPTELAGALESTEA